MYRHRFDAVSLFFGLILTAVGTAVLLNESTPNLFVGRWLWPTLFVAGGIVLLVGLLPSREAKPSGPVESDDEGFPE